jgi:hypothetical protein
MNGGAHFCLDLKNFLQKFQGRLSLFLTHQPLLLSKFQPSTAKPSNFASQLLKPFIFDPRAISKLLKTTSEVELKWF